MRTDTILTQIWSFSHALQLVYGNKICMYHKIIAKWFLITWPPTIQNVQCSLRFQTACVSIRVYQEHRNKVVEKPVCSLHMNNAACLVIRKPGGRRGRPRDTGFLYIMDSVRASEFQTVSHVALERRGVLWFLRLLLVHIGPLKSNIFAFIRRVACAQCLE